MFAVLSVSCGGPASKGLCPAAPPCPNDPLPTMEELAACAARDDAAVACHGALVTLTTCVTSNTVCGSDGQSDLQRSSEKAAQACAAQTQAYASCCEASPGTTVCPG